MCLGENYSRTAPGGGPSKDEKAILIQMQLQLGSYKYI